MKWINALIISLFLVSSLLIEGQEQIPIIKNLSEIQQNKSGIYNYWLEMGENTYNYPMLVPVILIQGLDKGPTLGLTAGIHGNELNGIPIIHRLVDSINTKTLKGRIIAIPGLNAFSIQVDERRFIDDEDLNRNFPGKKNGNRSQQYAYKISERVLPSFDIHIDMHTASFGRVNSLYARVDASNDTLVMLAKLNQPDIILNSIGASAETGASTRTMRAEAGTKGMQSVTIEYGNPQVFQSDMTNRGYRGILNTLAWLKMYGDVDLKTFKDEATYCKKSYWIYMDEGGFLEVTVALKQKVKKGALIARVKNAFGDIIKEYKAPEDGIIIGKSTNPTNMSGGRIIHLGILQ